MYKSAMKNTAKKKSAQKILFSSKNIYFYKKLLKVNKTKIGVGSHKHYKQKNIESNIFHTAFFSLF